MLVLCVCDLVLFFVCGFCVLVLLCLRFGVLFEAVLFTLAEKSDKRTKAPVWRSPC